MKYLQEGWTVRPVDTPLDFDDNETEEVELNSLARKSARGIKTKVFIFNFKTIITVILLGPSQIRDYTCRQVFVTARVKSL